MTTASQRRTNRERQRRYRLAHPLIVRARRRAWAKTKAGRVSKRRQDQRRHHRKTTPAERKARLLFVREHLAHKRAALKRGGWLPPTLDQTKAEMVRRFFISAGVAEAGGDEAAADEMREMAVDLRGPVTRPEGTGLVGAEQREQAEPISSEGITLDDVPPFEMA